MNFIIKKFLSIFLITLLFSFSHSSSAATTPTAPAPAPSSGVTADPDATTQVICNIVEYVWSIGGPLMTVVIIGAAMMAIFGRMPWPALFALGVFCAVFFGAATIVTKLMGSVGTGKGSSVQCGTTAPP